MKILFDYQIFSMQKYGGISRYYIELMLEYRRMNQKFDLPIYYSNNVYISNIKNIKNYSNSRVLNKIASIFNNYISKKYINRGQYDIFHPTYYNPYFTKNLTIPYVLTIYDFTHEKFNDVSNRKDRTIQWKREVALGASRIIAISENTKKDIIKYYGIDERKIDVVYLASSLEKILDHPNVDIPGKYLLYVGNRG
jgi:glycosyltransferase involved in cell wall biosynthesis